MSGVKWIKLSTAMFEDEKIRIIESLPEAHSILLIWVKLLILAGKKNLHGEVFINEDVPYTEEMLSTIFSVKLNTVRLALQTFARFRMIEIQTDGTIVIVNWFKHQNLEGLEKIRQENAAAAKRYRLKRSGGNAGAPSHDASRDCHVTRHARVIEPSCNVMQQNKSKSTEKDPLPSPKGGSEKEGIESDDPIEDIEEAKAWLSSLFHRNRHWTYEELQLLKDILPVNRDDKALIDWAYVLPPSHRFHEQTKLKQELTTLLREFNGELDKIKAVRRRMGMSGAPSRRLPAVTQSGT